MTRLDRRTKVLHVCPAYFPTRGGIEVLIESLVPILKAQFSTDSEIVAPRHRKERPDSFEHAGALVHSVDLFAAVPADQAARAFAKIFSSVRRVIASAEPQIVHVHGFSPLALAASSIARTMGIPYIAHIHGEIDPALPRHFLRLVAEANQILAVSHAVSTSITDRVPGARSVLTVPNGISPIEPQPAESRGKRLLCVGRLEPEKGFEDVVAAMPGILRAHPQAELTIIGFGQGLYSLQSLASRLGVAEKIRFLGSQSHDDVIAEIIQSTIVLVPSQKTEGFSLVAAEAAMIGRPVVATRVGGLKETVVHETTGILVAPYSPKDIADSVIRLLSDSSTYDLLAESASRHAVSSFSMGRFAGDLHRQYSALIEEPGNYGD